MFRGFVVENNAPVRAALVEGLAELAGVTTVGYAVDERTSVAWLTDPANDWDIAIVDLHLGNGGSGYGVLEVLAKRQPHQRVVVWTASADSREKEPVPGAWRRSRVRPGDRKFATDAVLHGAIRSAGPRRERVGPLSTTSAASRPARLDRRGAVRRLRSWPAVLPIDPG